MIQAKSQKTSKNDFGLNEEEMLKAGLHFGHKTSKLYPKMKPYIFGLRNNVYLIDLEKTVEKLNQALQFIEKSTKEGKVLLFVGTKIQNKEFIENLAKECGFPYVTERWLGGTLTNFSVMRKRMGYLKELEENKNSKEFEKYTKKERKEIEKELHNLEIKFGGIRSLETLPDVIFICDMEKDITVVKEARIKGIPIIGICDTNVDPTLADYPIPANDDAVSSIKYILEKVKEVILKAKPQNK